MRISKHMRRLGWIAFTLAWIPFTTFFIGMIGMPDGDYAWIELPLLSRGSIVAGGVLFGLSTIMLIGAPILSGLSNQAVLKNGRPAMAKIVAITDTGTTINENPVVRFTLEVTPSDGMPFQAEAEKLISRLQVPSIQPGAMVHVMYDPDSKAVALAEE